MREILYIQAGPLANFAGTHFWNTQEQYLTYSESESFSVEHDVSFREGSDKKGNSIYCPRLLVFDRKSQFGTLARNGVLYGDDDDELPNAWDGSSVELRQEAIPDHPYQTKLLEGESGIGESASITQDVKFWSDFNRVYYHPRSIQMLPDISDWQGAEGDWIHGLNSFTHFAEETDVMETSMRLFLEECDAFQGMQVINDTATFGSFTHSLLSTFHDELSKAPSIVFPLLANVVPRGKHIDEPSSTRKILNDALFLRGQNDLSLTTVPIQSPLSWNEPPWKNILSLTVCLYFISSSTAILSRNEGQ
ncbi:protein dml1 [Moniliophthora roreri MCA 2997]|uniref:Protein dml1 n=1 Tax=Moniliophthora roreri (strain MCA 2997) TaxID=1381753 RepID=V2WI21_MONRO|nr:protein dml1 [Moniliophthora roreri MCA 2997]